MKIILSPAKKLNENKVSFPNTTSIKFNKECNELVGILAKYDSSQIKELMNVSDNIAHSNVNRFSKFQYPLDNKICKPSIYMFDGAVYSAININDFSDKEIKILQEKLRILSGLYGILKPLDLIMPYRLEMGTKFKENFSSLYDFWGSKLTNFLKSEVDDNELLINLASNEYSKVLDLKSFENVVTPVFKDFKNGDFKVISFFAKKARGLFTRYLIKENINSIEGLKLFNSGGYSFNEFQSNGNMIFTR